MHAGLSLLWFSPCVHTNTHTVPCCLVTSGSSSYFLVITKAVAAGMNPMDLRKGIKLATDHVVSVLSDISKPISTKEEVAQVGTISANR